MRAQCNMCYRALRTSCFITSLSHGLTSCESIPTPLDYFHRLRTLDGNWDAINELRCCGTTLHALRVECCGCAAAKTGFDLSNGCALQLHEEKSTRHCLSKHVYIQRAIKADVSRSPDAVPSLKSKQTFSPICCAGVATSNLIQGQ